MTPWAQVSNTSEEDRPVSRGDSNGRYVVLHQVGRGGMAVVAWGDAPVGHAPHDPRPTRLRQAIVRDRAGR